jgi:hypothetical protein
MTTVAVDIHEPAGSVHTVDIPAANGGPTEIPFIIEGVRFNMTPDGSVGRISNGVGTLAANEALGVDQGFDQPTGVIVS